MQDDVDGDVNDGGSWYSYPGDGIEANILKTGNLVFEMAFVGDDLTTQRVSDATDYLARYWNDASGINTPPGWNGTPAQYQTMFTGIPSKSEGNSEKWKYTESSMMVLVLSSDKR